MHFYDDPSFALTYADATRQLDTSHLRSRFLGHVRRLERALRDGGVLYASFKPGERERNVDDGRHFTDMTEARIRDRIRDAPGLGVIEVWQTSDVRPQRAREPWLNALLRRKPR